MSDTGYNSQLADPELLTNICSDVAAGRTLAMFAADHKMPFKLLNRWIADDEKRALRYKTALEIRDEHAKDLIVAELVAYLKADVTEAFDDGNLKMVADMPENLRRMISGIKFREIFQMQGTRGNKQPVHIGNIIEVKFIDKVKTMELFMRNLAMLVDRKEITGSISLADLIASVDGEKKP